MSSNRPSPYRSARALLALVLAFSQVASVLAGTFEITESGLNARSSLSFRGNGNRLTTIPKGTTGEVLQRWKLPSGNFGVKIRIKKLGSTDTSLKLEEEVWVYYHQDSTRRRVELLDDDGKKVANAEKGNWAIALSSFRTERSTPKKETACATCSAEVLGESTAPLTSGLSDNLEKIVEAVGSDSEGIAEKENTPNAEVGVEELITYISAAQASSVSRRTKEKYNRRIAEAVIKESKEQGIPLSLILGIIETESHFILKNSSHKGARGIMQMMQITYRDVTDGRRDYSKLDIPETAIKLGVQYFAKQLKKYGNIEDALRAYNCGPNKYDKYLAGKYKLSGETRKYVPKVLKNQANYLAYEKTSGTSISIASN